MASENLLHRLLNYYHLTEAEYQNLLAPVSEDNFALGHHFEKMEEAIDLLRSVMKQKGKIFIYGDYDADGVMGTSILVKMFMYEKYPVSSYLPNRYEDGYGLTLKKAQEAIEKGISLVLTVDNGVTAFEPIALLHAHGVKVIVLDHHQNLDHLPLADFIIHPILSHFGTVPSSGAFTAFMFSLSFLGRYDKYLATLAAISLISDMMPILEYNRNLLRLVIQEYRDGEFPAIDALKDGEPFNEVSIGMKIAPKINAIGRLIDGPEINHLVGLFTRDDTSHLLNYIEWINGVNDNRKNASREASDSLTDFSSSDAAIVIISEAKEGLLGLIANQLCNKYHVPCLVFAKDKSGEILKGSCRAPDGFNIVKAFEKLSPFLLTAGGHAMAGGCSIKSDSFEEFKAAFLSLAQSTPIVPATKDCVNLGITEINEASYEIVQSFSPFGEKWPSPLFSLKRLNVSALFFSRDGQHILTQLGRGVKITGFNISRDSLKEYRYIDCLGTLRKSSYRGNENIEFLISKISEAYNI